MQRSHRLQTERSCDVCAVVANRVTRKFIMSEKQIYRKHAPGLRWQKENEHIRVLKTGCWAARVLGWGVHL